MKFIFGFVILTSTAAFAGPLEDVLFCQSQMAKAVHGAVKAKAQSENPGKEIDVFEGSTSSSVVGNPLDRGSVSGSFYVGGFRNGGRENSFKAFVYLKTGTCNVESVDITDVTSGDVLE